jgi:hypothetical protein
LNPSLLLSIIQEVKMSVEQDENRSEVAELGSVSPEKSDAEEIKREERGDSLDQIKSFESEVKSPELSEIDLRNLAESRLRFDVDDAARYTFKNERARVLHDTREISDPPDINDEKIKADLRLLGYNPDDFQTVYYVVEVPQDKEGKNKLYYTMTAFEASFDDHQAFYAGHDGSRNRH